MVKSRQYAILEKQQAQAERLRLLAYRCEAHQDEEAGCPCCDAVHNDDLVAEAERYKAALVETCRGHNVRGSDGPCDCAGCRALEEAPGA